jgi:serine/threonine protein kinase
MEIQLTVYCQYYILKFRDGISDDLEHIMSDFIGKSLGRYHILEQLGEGGMAVVYKAYDTRLETDVAVKVIRTENLPQSGVERALKRFEREAKSLAKLTHSNIVPIIDYGENAGSPYLVMKYLPGGTLKQHLGQPMPYQEAARILAPIARALEYAHQHDIIHRDVKPSNILITESGQPMLSDFGVAKILEADETMDLTGTSMGVGTPEYMAPEQVTSKTSDGRGDIYSLGVVFFELVTGRKPFMADTPMAVLFKQASEPLPRPRQFVPGLSDAVEKVLFKALAKKPEDRYQTMGEFAVALERLANWQIVGAESKLGWKRKVAEEPEQEMALPSMERRNKSIKWAGWGAIGILAIVVVLGFMFGFGILTPGQKGLGLLAALTVKTVPSIPTRSPTSTILSSSTFKPIIGITPSATPELGLITPTLPEIATTLPSGTVLFTDNFESGISNWNVGPNWEIRSDNGINHYFCVRPQDSNYTYASTGSQTWANYILELKVLVVDDSSDGSVNIDVRETPGSSYSDYLYEFSQHWSGLSTEVGPPYNKQVLASTTNPRFTIGKWQNIRMGITGTALSVFLDNQLFFQANDDSLKNGEIMLGAGGKGWNVCFDDIKVTALGE